MYAYFIGKVAEIGADKIVLETNNIGYNIFMPGSDMMSMRIGDEVKIYTYTSVREDAFVLFGFIDNERLSFFKQLLQVNGVGPKVAIGILSNSTVEDLYMAILSGDSKSLSKVPGIGAKTAARIILDLKDKISTETILGSKKDSVSINQNTKSTGIKAEAIEALGALGYSPSEALKAINSVEINEDMTVEDLIRASLILM